MPNRSSRKIPDVERNGDGRTAFQRDRDRVLYSTALRRLGSVTQVTSPAEGRVFHTRLTHTLKVAQVSRRIAERIVGETGGDWLTHLGGLDPDAAETAALAHDLGHPPFGHAAEEELAKFASDIGGFEGNAQSLRVVCTLESPGLNLTCASIRGLLKYPWLQRDGVKKFGAYDEEREVFEWATDGGGVQRSIEAQIMDWADDITYAIHDLQDFYQAGLIPLHEFNEPFDDASGNANSEEVSWFWQRGAPRLCEELGIAEDELRYEFSKLMTFISMSLRGRFRGQREQLTELRTLASMLITQCLNATRLRTAEEETEEEALVIEQFAERRVAIMKELTWQYVIKNPALARQQLAQRRIVRELCELLWNELRQDRTDKELSADNPFGFGSELMIAALRDLFDECDTDTQRKRIVVDNVASLSDIEAVKVHNRLTGYDGWSILDFVP